MSQIDYEEQVSPEALAKILFQQNPGKESSICILPYSKSYVENSDEASFNFEILLTIYLEGLMNLIDVIVDNKTNDVVSTQQKEANDSFEMQHEIFNNITIDDLVFPDPWFKSFGYKINVKECSYTDKTSSYCRTLLIFDPKDRNYFINKGINKRYTFLLTVTYKPTKILDQIYTIFNNKNKYYKIWFSKI